MLINATRLNIKSKYKEYLHTVSSSVFKTNDEDKNEFVNCSGPLPVAFDLGNCKFDLSICVCCKIFLGLLGLKF